MQCMSNATGYLHRGHSLNSFDHPGPRIGRVASDRANAGLDVGHDFVHISSYPTSTRAYVSLVRSSTSAGSGSDSLYRLSPFPCLMAGTCRPSLGHLFYALYLGCCSWFMQAERLRYFVVVFANCEVSSIRRIVTFT